MKEATIMLRGVTLLLLFILLFNGNTLAQQEITITTNPVDLSTLELEPGTSTTIDIMISNVGDAPLTWSAQRSDFYGRGPAVIFVKEDFANWLLPSNQDRISDYVWMARNDTQSLFNAKSESSSSSNSPLGTEWALGALNDVAEEDFTTFQSMHGGDPSGLIGEITTLYDQQDETYYELDFSAWSGGGPGGGFGYSRSEMHEYVYFNSITSGTLLAAEGTTVSVVVTAEELASGDFSSIITILSDDADESEVDFPIDLTVFEGPSISLSTTSISQTLTTGDEPVEETITITNSGESTLNWEFDADLPFEIDEVIDASSDAGSITADSEQIITLTYNPGSAPEGVYEGEVYLLSNDVDNPVITIDVSITIIGEALIDFEAPTFSTTFVGTTSSEVLTIFNEGTADLEISSITSDASQFVSSQSQLTVAPGETEDIDILFSPDASGEVTANLTIASNDSESPSVVASLSGTGQEPPVMDATPTSFTEAVDQDDVLERSFTISNNGGSSLEWVYQINQEVFKNSATEVSFEKMDNADPSLEANQDRVSENVWITRDSDGGLYDYNDVEDIEWAFGPTSEASPSDYSSSFRNAANGFAIGLPGQTLSLHLVNQNRYFDLEIISWTCCSSGGGFSYLRTEYTGAIQTDESSNPDLISDGESYTFNFNVVGEGVHQGSYESEIVISSNDPIQPELIVTVEVDVTGEADISNTTDEIGVETEVGSALSFSVIVENSGTADLVVSNATTDNSVFAVAGSTSFTVAPGDVHDLEMTYSPTGVEETTASLTIASNDAANASYVISLDGNGVAAPTIDISATTFTETLEAGLSSNDQSFTISNTGDGTLDWELEGIFMEKEDYADPSLEENQDRIFEDIWLTRDDDGALYNAFTGEEYSSTLLWGDGPTATLSLDEGDYYQGMRDFGGLSSLPGSTISLYAVEYDTYFDLEFISWTNGDGSGGEPGGGFSYIRREAVPWLELSNSLPEISSSGSGLVSITFNAQELLAGEYSFTQSISSNDPSNPSTDITFNLTVTGSPAISLGTSTVEFENEFIGLTGSQELQIENEGSSDLVISNIAIDNDVFAVDQTSLTVAPGESETLTVSFSPTEADSYAGQMTITSNDDSSPSLVSLLGDGENPPNLSVGTSSIEVELLSGGASEQTVTLTNNGSLSLNWEVVGVIADGAEAVTFEKENFADWTLAENQDRINDEVWITRADQQGLFNAAQESSYNEGDGGERIAIELPDFEEEEGSPIGTRWSENPTYLSNEEEYTDWRSAADGNAGDLPGQTLSMYLVEEGTYHDVTFTSWTAGSGCCDFENNGGGFAYSRIEAVGWVTDFASTDGSISGEGGTEELSFFVNAEGLSAGEYNATVIVTDGFNERSIAVTLTVLGLPEIFVDEESLDFETVFTGESSTLELEVSNVGFDDLTISGISADNDDFAASGPSVIGAGQTGVFEVTYTPSSEGSVSSTLTIASDDPLNSSVTVGLAGIGANPPEISVDATALNQTLFFGASGSQTITITNSGSSDLIWNFGVSGDAVEFVKEDFADWTLAENQDRISENVWITRADRRGIFNIAVEAEYDRDERDSPEGTLWSRGATGSPEEGGEGPCCCCIEAKSDKLSECCCCDFKGAKMGCCGFKASEFIDEYYTDWADAAGGEGDVDDIADDGQIFSMYIVEKDFYYDVEFITWTQGSEGGPSGGGFGYIRTPAFFEYEAVSFSATEGVVAPGESQTVTIFFNPNGTFSGTFDLPLQIESNDPSGPVEIPITMNVNGIIVDEPIDDQLAVEGFSSTTIDISSLFADAQDDALSYTVATSDGNIITAAESAEELTVTEVGTGTATITLEATDGKGSEDSYSFDFRVNAIPDVANAIADQSYDEGFGSATIDVSTVFTDLDGDDLTYSIDNSADGIVTVALNEGVITITEQGLGTSTVTLTADDGLGGTEDESFDVVVNDVLGLGPNSTIRVYPNPVVDFMTISQSSASSIEIYDLKGAKVLVSEMKERVDLRSLTSGIYSVKLLDTNGDLVESGQIIKK